MTNDILIFEEVLKRYKLTEPVPADVRSRILAGKKAFFIKLCRRLGIYNIFFAAAITVFFAVKKIGLTLSLVQSYVVLITASALITGAITCVGYTAVKSVLNQDVKEELQLPCPLDEKPHIKPVDISPFQALYMTPNHGADPLPSGGTAPSLNLNMLSITLAGVSPESKDTLYEALTGSLKRFYPGSFNREAASSLSLKGSLIKTETGHDLYLRLVRPDGGIFRSFHYSSGTVQELLSRTDAMARDIAQGVREQ